jgi:acetyltransferase EpsM
VRTLKRILIIGGTGGGQIASAVIEELNEKDPTWELIGFLNDDKKLTHIGKYPIVGRTEEAADYAEKGYYLHYALHNAKTGHLRAKRFLEMRIPLEVFPQLIHPGSYSRMAASIGHGVLAAPFVNMSFGAKVGNFCHLYGGSFLGHDCTIGDFTSIANNACIGGEVEIGEGCHIGTNSSLREHVKIGKHAIVGIGAVILDNVKDKQIAVGNPAKIIGSVDKYSD